MTGHQREHGLHGAGDIFIGQTIVTVPPSLLERDYPSLYQFGEMAAGSLAGLRWQQTQGPLQEQLCPLIT